MQQTDRQEAAASIITSSKHAPQMAESESQQVTPDDLSQFCGVAQQLPESVPMPIPETKPPFKSGRRKPR